MNVRLVPPATVPSLVIVAIVPLLLVTVTVTGLGGVAPRLTNKDVCRSRPTVALPIEMFGAVTVAVIDWRLLGVVKPAGVVRLTVLVPDATGSKAVPKFDEDVAGEDRWTADDGAHVRVGARHRDVDRQPATQGLRLRVGQRRRMEQRRVDPDGLVQRERVGVDVTHVQDEP